MGLFYFDYRSKNELTGIGDLDWHDDVNNIGSSGIGGRITLGWAPAGWLSIGLGISLYANTRTSTLVNPLYGQPGEESLVDDEQTLFVPAPSLGILFRNRDSSLIYDIYGGFSLEKMVFVDLQSFPVPAGEETLLMTPLFVEHTFTLSFNQSRTFFVLKQLNNIHLDSGNYYGRLMPAFEHWITHWLSIRLGVEGALMKIGGSLDWGIGGTGGLSLCIRSWGLDVDVNVTVRRRPSRIVAGQQLYEIIPLIIVTKTKPYGS